MGQATSTRAQAIRARGRRAARRHDVVIDDMVAHTLFKPLNEWTLEELAKGKPRNPDGTWRNGPALKWIGPALVKEIKARLMTVGMQEMAAHLGPAIKVVGNLIDNDELMPDGSGRPLVDSKTKLDAAKFIIEQVMGKAKSTVELDTADGYKEFLASALVIDGGKPAHPVVIDGTFTEEDDDGG